MLNFFIGTTHKRDDVMQIFKYRDGVVPNSCAFIYVFLGYPLSFYWAAQSNFLFNLLALLLLSHSMIIAGYLLHECIHKTLLSDNNKNISLAILLSWITGACYSEYDCLKKKHMRHHANRIDSLAIDHQSLLQKHPLLCRIVEALEWCYIPAVEILTHALSILAPFIVPSRQHQRKRVLKIIALRFLFFLILALWSWKIVLIYSFSYLIFIRVLGFMDAFQHIYHVRLNLDEEKVYPEFERDYEEAHTWSNLLSEKHPWLNLLVLNFCYHNVHHHRPAEPWYRLPLLHGNHYEEKTAPEVSLKQQLSDFHKYRISRVKGMDDVPEGINEGAAGVSFLVGV
jgi:fatty acid desaturase